MLQCWTIESSVVVNGSLPAVRFAVVCIHYWLWFSTFILIWHSDITVDVIIYCIDCFDFFFVVWDVEDYVGLVRFLVNYGMNWSFRIQICYYCNVNAWFDLTCKSAFVGEFEFDVCYLDMFFSGYGNEQGKSDPTRKGAALRSPLVKVRSCSLICYSYMLEICPNYVLCFSINYFYKR